MTDQVRDQGDPQVVASLLKIVNPTGRIASPSMAKISRLLAKNGLPLSVSWFSTTPLHLSCESENPPERCQPTFIGSHT